MILTRAFMVCNIHNPEIIWVACQTIITHTAAGHAIDAPYNVSHQIIKTTLAICCSKYIIVPSVAFASMVSLKSSVGIRFAINTLSLTRNAMVAIIGATCF